MIQAASSTLLFMLVLLPTWIAIFRRRSDVARLALANVLLGWTWATWLALIAYAVLTTPKGK